MRLLQLLALSLCLMLGVLSCGKVTQVVKEDPPIKSFNMTSNVTISNQTLSATTNATVIFTTQTPELYITVNGIKPDGKTSLLSWGKGTMTRLTKDAKTQQPVSPSLTITTTRRDGLTLKGNSQYMWSKFMSPDKTNTIKVVSNEVKQGFRYYQVIVFSDAETYLMRLFDGDSVSKNKTVNCPPLTPYNTFIDTLFWRHLASVNYTPKKALNRDTLRKFFSISIFTELNDTFTGNAVKSFDVKNPVFSLSDPRSDVLLELYQHYLDGKKRDFQAYLKTISFLNDTIKTELAKKLP